MTVQYVPPAWVATETGQLLNLQHVYRFYLRLDSPKQWVVTASLPDALVDVTVPRSMGEAEQQLNRLTEILSHPAYVVRPEATP